MNCLTLCLSLGGYLSCLGGIKYSKLIRKTGHIYNIIPKTIKGKISLGILLSGFLIFLTGVFLGSAGFVISSFIAVAGMVIYFIGGILRAYTN